jgi:predicted DCC family thiol-disulfide oxidoreductase YuxK
MTLPPRPPETRRSTAIVLFDGHCNLCTGSVQRLIRLDPRQHLRFASLQSNVGQHYLRAFSIPADTDSFVVVHEGRAWLQGDGVLAVGRALGGYWKVPATVGLLVPRPLRNAMYAYLARNRYGWFGATDSCWVPSPALRGRFQVDNEGAHV